MARRRLLGNDLWARHLEPSADEREIARFYTLGPDELAQVMARRSDANRLVASQADDSLEFDLEEPIWMVRPIDASNGNDAADQVGHIIVAGLAERGAEPAAVPP